MLVSISFIYTRHDNNFCPANNFLCNLGMRNLLNNFFIWTHCTFLKIKNKSNSIWVTYNFFPLIKRTFWSWVDFSRLNYLKKCTQTWVIWVHASLIKIKSKLSDASIWVYWTDNQICALDINPHNDQGCTGIGPVLLSLAAGQNQTALTIWSRRHTSNRNNEKYIDKRSNFVNTDKKVMNEL